MSEKIFVTTCSNRGYDCCDSTLEFKDEKEFLEAYNNKFQYTFGNNMIVSIIKGEKLKVVPIEKEIVKEYGLQKK